MPPICPHAPAVKSDDPKLAEEQTDAQVECLEKVANVVPPFCEEPSKQEALQTASSVKSDGFKLAEESIDPMVENIEKACNDISLGESIDPMVEDIEKASNDISLGEKPSKEGLQITEEEYEFHSKDPLSMETDPNPESILEEESALLPASKRLKRDLS